MHVYILGPDVYSLKSMNAYSLACIHIYYTCFRVYGHTLILKVWTHTIVRTYTCKEWFTLSVYTVDSISAAQTPAVWCLSVLRWPIGPVGQRKADRRPPRALSASPSQALCRRRPAGCSSAAVKVTFFFFNLDFLFLVTILVSLVNWIS